ncbi:MAG: hypothetical protein CEE43_05785 [Promethearchaeota archaeon Loki_b32]|nr:MAG: hypothetical protein CEE43_05785 [Candidatus Lokiarchaeota archaeon Loki_b32]
MSEDNNKFGWDSEFSDELIEFTQPDIMVKLVSTIDLRGWPHLTIITSNRGKSRDQIVWGQFYAGTSKEYVQKDPKQGIFYMTTEAPFKFIQVKADFTHTKNEGEDLDYFNQSDFFRYFTYINVYKVFYNDVVAVTPIRNLPPGNIPRKIVKAIIKEAKTNIEEKRLNVIGYKLFTNKIGVRAIAYIDPSDGYPVIIPHLQLNAVDHNRLYFPLTALKEDFLKIPVNSKVAVIGANFDMASQVVKGTFTGIHSVESIEYGLIDIEEIYNSSPPIVGKIYPEIETRPKVNNFTL